MSPHRPLVQPSSGCHFGVPAPCQAPCWCGASQNHQIPGWREPWGWVSPSSPHTPPPCRAGTWQGWTHTQCLGFSTLFPPRTGFELPGRWCLLKLSFPICKMEIRIPSTLVVVRMGRAVRWRGRPPSQGLALPQAPFSPRTTSSWPSTGRASTSWTSRSRCSWSCPSPRSWLCPAVGESQPPTAPRAEQGDSEAAETLAGVGLTCSVLTQPGLTGGAAGGGTDRRMGKEKAPRAFLWVTRPLRGGSGSRRTSPRREARSGLSWSRVIEQFVLHCASPLTGMEGGLAVD